MGIPVSQTEDGLYPLEIAQKPSLLKQLEDAFITHSPRSEELTIGIEREFFLITSDGALADHQQSQLFLAELKGSTPNRIKLSATGVIEEVSFEHDNGSYSKFKYEVDPYLLEISYGYFDDLQRLEVELRSRKNQITKAADQVGLKVVNKPFLNKALIPLAINNAKDPNGTHESRLKYARSRDPNLPEELIHFPLYTAGVQTHLGGIPWQNNFDILKTLYNAELQYLPSVIKRIPSYLDAYLTRVMLYTKAFPGFKLVCFPALTDITKNEWLHALLHSPLSGLDPFGGLTPVEIINNGNGVPDDLPSLVRDLQFIKPRLFGTVEYRSDPAFEQIEDIMYLAALRFAVGLSVIYQSKDISPNWDTIRSSWQKGVSSRRFGGSTSVNTLKKILKNRSKGEEKYLE